MKLISKGAEANIFGSNDIIRKKRVVKGYREGELDDHLRKTRTKREAKLISLARRSGVATPLIRDVDNKGTIIEMKNINGRCVREVLDDLVNKDRKRVCCEIGRNVARLHSANIVHGDLTTANMLLSGDIVYFIDFGLGEISESIEDKGVDILVFKKVLYSTHHSYFRECYKAFLDGYSEYEKHNEVVERLKSIEKRGRYFSER
ncbi:MAG: KEOPS complex kinase/ATPase Bud32 [Candidatus Hydrothermarchaeales archaeon]